MGEAAGIRQLLVRLATLSQADRITQVLLSNARPWLHRRRYRRSTDMGGRSRMAYLLKSVTELSCFLYYCSSGTVVFVRVSDN